MLVLLPCLHTVIHIISVRAVNKVYMAVHLVDFFRAAFVRILLLFVSVPEFGRLEGYKDSKYLF